MTGILLQEEKLNKKKSTPNSVDKNIPKQDYSTPDSFDKNTPEQQEKKHQTVVTGILLNKKKSTSNSVELNTPEQEEE